MTLSTPQVHIKAEDLRTSPVFDWNYKSKARIKINQGGTSSGKTYAILQVLILRLINEPLICTVVGQDIPNLKKGALRDLQERIIPDNPWINYYIKSYNKTDRTYRFINGSVLEFTSYKDSQDAKNGKRDLLFINEANGVDWSIYEQLEMRTTREIWLDYNPTAEFWAHERLMVRSNAVTFYSNYSHNPFIDEATREYILSLKDTDFQTWLVYGLGKTGQIAELVYEPFTLVDEMPKHLKRRGYGIDFGYRAHPTAMVECGLLNERDLYLDERFYTYRMKTGDINIAMGAIGINKKRGIYGDPADPRAIDDLTAYGWKMVPAIKGADSVNYGLQLLKQYNIFVTKRSVNIINERKRYRHKIDKKTGKITNEVVKAWDDALDAIRYYGVMNLKPIRKIRTSWRGAVA